MHTLGEIQPGQILGRYELLLPIAQGGMAAVWAARLKGSRGFSKTVAVKTMLPTISDDPLFEQMFLDEARIASRIKHPNVAEILDLGEEEDVLYLVMEWVDGEPLSTIRRVAAKQGGFSRPIAVKIVADVAAGLHAAHELKDELGDPLGLVHRDISPQNVLITYDGAVKIVDFGVAKSAGRTSQESDAGQIKGKPPYMSPEQALGNDIDRRTDVFALGIILYQLTTGRHPFRGETDRVTLHNIVSDRPIMSPRAYVDDYPKSLETVVMTALERDLDKRYQTARAFEQALERVFPPTVRVRSEDVAGFISGLLGERADVRRTALREAVRRADEREAWELGISPEELRTSSGLSAVTRRKSEPPGRRSEPPRSRSAFPSGRPRAPSVPPGSLRATPEIAAALFAPTPVTRPEFVPALGSFDRPEERGAGEHDSALSSGSPAPTPYGTQTPSRPAPPLGKSRVTRWLALGLGLAALAVSGVVVLERGRSRSTPPEGRAPAAEPPPALARAAAPPKLPDPAPKLEPSTEDAGAPSHGASRTTEARTSTPVRRSDSEARPLDSAQKREEKKPEAPRPAKSEFEPPPVSDPGF